MPILTLEDRWILLAPHALLSATTREVLRLVQQADQCITFDRHLNEVQHVSTQLAMSRLGCEYLPSQNGQELTPGTVWYALDSDKIISVTNFVQRVAEVDTTNILGPWHPALPPQPPPAPEAIYSPHVLHLLVMCDLGDSYRVPVSKAWVPEQVISMRPDDLAALAAAYREDSTVLWRLQRSRVALRKAVQLRFHNPIDEIALLSQWDFPRSFPFPQRAALYANGQMGADWRRKIQAERHEHAVPWIDGTTLTLVERSQYMPPTIYSCLMPLWSEAHVLVEQNNQTVWVLDERGHELGDVPDTNEHDEVEHDLELAPLLQALPSLVQGIAVWLTHLLPALDHAQKQSSNASVTTVLVGVERHIQPCRASLEPGKRTVRLTLAPTFLKLLQRADNSAERELVRTLTTGMRLLEGASTKVKQINRIVEAVAPRGDKRLIMRHQSIFDTQLDPRGLVPVRYARPGEQHEWAVHVGQLLAKRHRWKPGQTLSATSSIAIEANEILYKELQVRLTMLDGEVLLPFLLDHYEAVRFEQEQLMASRISRELIFGSNTKPFHPASDGTAVALRFLLEVIAAKLPVGKAFPSLTMLDELLGLAVLMIHYGQVGDALNYKVGQVSACLEADGALSMNADDYKRTMLTLRSNALKEGAIRANRERYEYADASVRATEVEVRSGSSSGEVSLQLIDAACQALYQLDVQQIMRFITGALNIGDGYEGGSIIMPLRQFVEEIQADTGWRLETVRLALDTLSLWERADFLTPPDGFLRSEVLPWQFNRALSLLKRPFIQVSIQDVPHIAWGNRALEASKRFWLEDQWLAGRLHKGTLGNPGAKQAAKAMQSLNTLRGEAFNLEVATTLREAGFHVMENVDRFGKLKLREGGDTLGDIDVLAWSAERRQLLLLECKAYAPARTPLELHYQLQEFLHGKPRVGKSPERPLIEKHLRRAKFVEGHLHQILEHLGISELDDWKVLPAYVMSNLPSELLKEQAPYPVLHVEELSLFIAGQQGLGMAPRA